jgi:hypothetical protein
MPQDHGKRRAELVTHRSEELGPLTEKPLHLLGALRDPQLERLVHRLELFGHLVGTRRQLTELVVPPDVRPSREVTAPERTVGLHE